MRTELVTTKTRAATADGRSAAGSPARAAAALSVATMLGLAAGLAHAGTVIESTTTDVRSRRAIEHTTLSAQGGSVRIDRRSAIDPDDRTVAIYTGEQLYVVDDHLKSYRVMDRAAVQRISAAREAQAKELGVDARTRAKARRTTRTVEPSYVDTGRSRKVGDWSCRVWNATLQGRTVARYCVVPAAKLGGEADLAKSLSTFGAFWREVAAGHTGLQDAGGRLVTALDRMKGVPIEATLLAGGKPQETVAVTAVRTQPVAATAFQVPKDYDRQTMVREADAQ